MRSLGNMAPEVPFTLIARREVVSQFTGREAVVGTRDGRVPEM